MRRQQLNSRKNPAYVLWHKLENPENEKLVYAWWCMSIQTNEYTKERYSLLYPRVIIQITNELNNERKSLSQTTKHHLRPKK